MEALVKRVARSADEEAVAALARFLVVRSCGYVEQVSEECCRAYVTAKSDPRTTAFAASWLGKGRGPHPDKLIELVGKFDGDWAVELAAKFDADDQELRREIAFLVNRRNRIAHGLNEGLGVRKALDLCMYAKQVADWFILRLDPRGSGGAST